MKMTARIRAWKILEKDSSIISEVPTGSTTYPGGSFMSSATLAIICRVAVPAK